MRSLNSLAMLGFSAAYTMSISFSFLPFLADSSTEYAGVPESKLKNK